MAPSFFTKLALTKETPTSRTPSPGPPQTRSGSVGRQTSDPHQSSPSSAVPKHIHASAGNRNSIEIGVVPPTPQDSLATNEAWSSSSVGADLTTSALASKSRKSLQTRRRGDSRSITSQDELNMLISRSQSPIPLNDDLVTPMPRSRVDLTKSPANKSTKSLTPESSQSNLKSRPPSIQLTEDNFTGEVKRSSSKSSSLFRRRKVNSPNGETPTDRMPSLNPGLLNGADDVTPTNGTDPVITSPRMGPRTAVPDVYSPVTPSNQRGWRKTSNKKPQGLAAAIAQSGISMANPYASAVSLQPTMSPVASPKLTPSVPNMGRSTPSRHRAASSVGSLPGRRQPSLMSSEGGDSDGIYDSDKSGSNPSETDDDMDFLSESMPVTGFAVASSKRNADFHELFKTVPEGDYLIEDYGCALQREILIQGRIYISENHICFHANIFGWITDLQIPFYEIVALEKKMTAFVIPNALQIDTRQAKYNFTSFLSRDTTYDVMYNIWRTARPSDSGSVVSGDMSHKSGEKGQIAVPVANGGASRHKVTQCACSRDNSHFSETALETIIPGNPEKIYTLIFASAWIKNFLVGNQKLLDLQISDWAPLPENSKLLFRQMSYIKPLNGSIGPKSTKCELRDEMLHCDFDDSVVMLTTTRTPDVPSGGAFSVKTRTCLTWASPASTKIVVTTQVEWTGRSFIKGIIESSAIQGQKQYHQDLEAAMREEIKENASEYVPEGVEVSVDAVPVQSPGAESMAAMTPGTKAAHDEAVQREKERNARGLQWAYETFEGAYEVGKKSASGAIDLIKETWEASSSTTILIFIVVTLVLSNIYTLTKVSSGSENRALRIKNQEREQWVHGVVTALWEELSNGGPGKPASPVQGGDGIPNWRQELVQIDKTLSSLEERMKAVRSSLNELI